MSQLLRRARHRSGKDRPRTEGARCRRAAPPWHARRVWRSPSLGRAMLCWNSCGTPQNAKTKGHTVTDRRAQFDIRWACNSRQADGARPRIRSFARLSRPSRPLPAGCPGGFHPSPVPGPTMRPIRLEYQTEDSDADAFPPRGYPRRFEKA